ncbi:MAG: hypothetical protein MUP63_04515 [Candidatus Nanohaloarchaeota archaeon QJJ-7]|nr:hypothetical protein [Candidatus Nanohaloarchaeota archaeon QJJ-7]
MEPRHLLLPFFLLLLAGATAAVSFPVHSQEDWEGGSFSGTEAVDGVLQVVDGESSGTYTSNTFDPGDNYTWSDAEVSSTLNGGSATLTVETSRDGFDSVLEQQSFSLSGGEESLNLSFNETRYVRFQYDLSGDTEVEGTNITIGDASSFIIRDDCQSDERELFSMSGRTNAHAGDPGYWPYSVCASGFERRYYTRVCSTGNTPILSFFGSEQTDIHIATDENLFNYKLCTSTLTVGIRDSCPPTTKAIVSVYEKREAHAAEPDYYPVQLCGAFFESVTAMMEFSMGPNTSVQLNDTENPSEDIYNDSSNQEPWFITAENGTLIAGIVSGEKTRTTEIGYQNESGNLRFNMTQDRGTMSYLLPFTTGTAEDVQDRINLIEAVNFIDQIKPSFGFPLAEEMTVRIIMQLQGIDLVSDFRLSAGSYTLNLENFGDKDSGTPKVAINVTG